MKKIAYLLLILFTISLQNSQAWVRHRVVGGAPAAGGADTFPDNDSFNRVGPGLGANWTQVSGGADIEIVSSTQINGDTPDTFAQAQYTEQGTLTADQGYACGKLIGSSSGSNDYTSVCLGMGASGNSACAIYGNHDGNYNLRDFSNTTETSCCGQGSSGTLDLAAGDYIGIERTSSTGFVYKYATAAAPTTWNTVDSQTITSVLSTGYPGIIDSGTGLNLDCFEAGNGLLSEMAGACCTND